MNEGFVVTKKETEYFKEYLTTENKPDRKENFSAIQKTKLTLVAHDLFQDKQRPLESKKLILNNLNSALNVNNETNEIFKRTFSPAEVENIVSEGNMAINNPYTVRNQLEVQLLQENILENIPPILDEEQIQDFDRWVTEVEALLNAKSEATDTFDQAISQAREEKRDITNDDKLEMLDEAYINTMNVFEELEQKLLEGAPTPLESTQLDTLRESIPEFAARLDEMTRHNIVRSKEKA